MPKIKHLRAVREVTHLEAEVQTMLLGQLILHLLQEGDLTLEELRELIDKTKDGLRKKGRL